MVYISVDSIKLLHKQFPPKPPRRRKETGPFLVYVTFSLPPSLWTFLLNSHIPHKKKIRRIAISM